MSQLCIKDKPYKAVFFKGFTWLVVIDSLDSLFQS
jgi:hypothetical protein